MDTKMFIHPIDVELHKRIKATAAMDGITIGEMMNKITRYYFDNVKDSGEQVAVDNLT